MEKIEKRQFESKYLVKETYGWWICNKTFEKSQPFNNSTTKRNGSEGLVWIKGLIPDISIPSQAASYLLESMMEHELPAFPWIFGGILYWFRTFPRLNGKGPTWENVFKSSTSHIFELSNSTQQMTRKPDSSHGTNGIYIYIYITYLFFPRRNQPNVGKYTIITWILWV